MSYKDVIDIILPPQGGNTAHITGHYGEQRDKGPHGGSDFNYVGGQSGINLQHPTVHSPVDGTVVFVGGQYGTIKIRDEFGNTHELLHTDEQLVERDQVVNAGTAIGTMGGRGPGGATAYAQHVHYQLKDANGRLRNPEEYWDQNLLLSHGDHPHSHLYRQTLNGVHAVEATHNISPGPHSESLAAALTVEAIRAHLTRVDRVELNDLGTLARAVQVSPIRDEAFLNTTTLPVGTEAASRQSLAWTSEQARLLDEASKVQQAEQPALVRGAGGMQR